MEMSSPQETPHHTKVLRPALLELFGELSETAAAEIASEFEWAILPAGETLFTQGDLPDDGVCVLLAGRLRVIFEHADGTAETVGEVAPGGIVGEIAMLTGERRSATVRAIRDSELGRLSKAGFDRLVEKYPRAILHIARTTATRLRQMISTPRLINCVTTVSILPVNPETPLTDFAMRLTEALSAFGSIVHLSSRHLDAALGKGMSQDDITDWGKTDSTIAQWLGEQEAKHHFVVYESDPDWSPWTQRCVRMADHILLVARADGKPTANDIVQQIAPDSPHQVHSHKELVLLHNDRKKQPTGTREWCALVPVERHHHLNMQTPADFGRLARRLTGREIGLVMGGGGARGFTHIGVLRALKEHGISIDFIGGTSMGALIGGMLALEYDEQKMSALNRKGWVGMRPTYDYTLPFVSLLSGRKIVKMLKMMFGDVQIEDLWTPYFAISSNISSAQVIIHQSGPLWRTIRASISLPGMAPPVPHHGDLLIDGTVLNNLPTDVMNKVSNGKIIAIDVNPRAALRAETAYGESLSALQIFWNWLNPFRQRLRVPNIYTVFDRATMLYSMHQAAVLKSNFADLYLHPPTDDFGLLDFKLLERIVETGYQYALPKIGTWKELQSSGA